METLIRAFGSACRAGPLLEFIKLAPACAALAFVSFGHAEESVVHPALRGIWRCDVSPETGEPEVLWFNFAPNGAQQWMDGPENGSSGWSEPFAWDKNDHRLSWAGQSGKRYYRGELSEGTIEGALFHDDIFSDAAGHFRCKATEGVPVRQDNAESAAVDLPAPADKTNTGVEPQPKPTPKRMVAPGYPEQALLQEVEGRVIVCFDVDTRGRVVEPVIMESTNAVFNEPVLKALARSRYEPARHEGKAVPSHSCRIFKFWLN